MSGVSDVSEVIERARLLVLDGADGDELYRRWFHDEREDVEDWPSEAAYRACLAAPERYEAGWQVVEAVGGRAGAVRVRGERAERVVAPPEVVPEDATALHWAPGQQVRVDPVISDMVGGFFHLWSSPWQQSPPATIRRIYLALAPASAATVLRRLAGCAPPDATWSAKALCGAHRGGRRDGALLYLPSDEPRTGGWVAGALAAVASGCAGGLAPFLVPLGPGIGWALDPGDGRSFGQAVSDALASVAAKAERPDEFADAAGRSLAAFMTAAESWR